MRVPVFVTPLVMFAAFDARAFILPYSTRTQNFSSWTPATQGDTNTIGMAGATVALPTSISSAEPNPAGYAMTTGSVSAQINTTTFNDSRLQRSGDSISSTQWGLAVSPEHWGFAIAYYSPETESGTYVSPNTGDTVKTQVELQELRLTVARTFFDDTLSLGLSLEIAKAVRQLDDASSNATGPGFMIGGLYRLPYHVLIGASIAPEINVGPAANPDPETVMPGFNRSVVVPTLITLGTGWIPSRFFKIGMSLTFAGQTDDTSLLYDQSIQTGRNVTWVPRIGASYVLAEYNGFKVELASGFYYEFSRLSGVSNRIHTTAGLDVNPSFINLGAGYDIASSYHNYIVSVGIDIVRTARFFELIPKDQVTPYHGVFPPVVRISAEGLPSGLTAGEPRRTEAQGVEEVEKIIENVPRNIEKKASGERTTVEVNEAKEKKRPIPHPTPGQTPSPP